MLAPLASLAITRSQPRDLLVDDGFQFALGGGVRHQRSAHSMQRYFTCCGACGRNCTACPHLQHLPVLLSAEHQRRWSAARKREIQHRQVSSDTAKVFGINGLSSCRVRVKLVEVEELVIEFLQERHDFLFKFRDPRIIARDAADEQAHRLRESGIVRNVIAPQKFVQAICHIACVTYFPAIAPPRSVSMCAQCLGI